MVTLPVQRSIATTPIRSLSSRFSSTPLTPAAAAGDGDDDDDDEYIISSAAAILRDHRSRSRWSHLRLSHPAGFTPSQAAGITIRIRNKPHLALRFFLWSHRRNLCRHDLSSYAAIVHILARSRLRPAALSLLQSALRSHDAADDVPAGKPPPAFEALARSYRACDSAPFVFDLLIRAYLLSNKLDRALQVTRLLSSKGIQPQISTSNSLIRSVSRSRGSDAAVEIYKELFFGGEKVRVRVSPNSQTFNTLLLACFREGRPDTAELIRGEMGKAGCYPSVFTYSILMAGFCEEGRIEEARELWEEMVAKQIKPDIVTFNTLIGGYCDAGEVESAEELFRDMELSGVEPTGTTFEHLVRGHCRAGDVDDALLVFGDMRRRGHSVEVAVVDEMIGEMCEKGRVEEGLGILREEMKRGGGRFCPSRISYELLIRGFCRKGDLEQALKLQAEMAVNGFEADSNVYRAFIEGYNKQGDAEKAGRLGDEMLEMCREKEEG